MTEDERRGRNIVLLISLGIVVPPALLIAVSLALGTTGSVGRWFRLGMAVLLSYLIWRGHSAARSYLALWLGLVAVVTAVFSLFLFPTAPVSATIGCLLGPLYFWASWLLWKSPKVEAFLSARERARNPVLSIRSDDGV